MHTVSRLISDETLSRIIHIESAGKPNAKAPTSSASGLGQFIKATWLGTVKKHKPAWAAGRSDSELLALRFEPKCAIEMLARFTEDNARALGAGWTDGDLYLAHFAGVGTARLLMRSDPSRAASSVFSAAAIAANRSILQGKSCGQVRSWAASKMAKASGRNWVAVHWNGAKPAASPAVKSAPVLIAGTAGGGAVVANAGWGPMEWAILLGCIAGASVGALLIWKFWPRERVAHVEQPET